MHVLPCLLPEVERLDLGAHGRALRRAVPRRARRVDGRDGAAVDQIRPRPQHLAAAVDRLRIRARLRRLPAARRARRRSARPPARATDRARRLHRGISARRPRQRRHRARGHALSQGRGRGVHRTGRPLDHHDPVHRRPGAQPRAQHLHRDGRQRVFARPRGGRAAHRARLALDVPAARPDRARAAGRRPTLPAARPGRAERPARVRPPRRRDAERRDAAARAHDRRGAQPGLGRAARRWPRSRSPRCFWPPSS